MKMLGTIMCAVLAALACVGVALGAEHTEVYALCAIAYGLLTVGYMDG